MGLYSEGGNPEILLICRAGQGRAGQGRAGQGRRADQEPGIPVTSEAGRADFATARRGCAGAGSLHRFGPVQGAKERMTIRAPLQPRTRGSAASRRPLARSACPCYTDRWFATPRRRLVGARSTAHIQCKKSLSINQLPRNQKVFGEEVGAKPPKNRVLVINSARRPSSGFRFYNRKKLSDVQGSTCAPRRRSHAALRPPPSHP